MISAFGWWWWGGKYNRSIYIYNIGYMLLLAGWDGAHTPTVSATAELDREATTGEIFQSRKHQLGCLT